MADESSPDLTPYVDFTVYDRDALQLFELFRAVMQVRFPDWTPYEGNTEVVIGEAVAVETEELIFAVNRVPSKLAEVLLRLFELRPSTGTPATATATFTLADTLGHTIPAGTRVRLDFSTGQVPMFLLTSEDLHVAAGAASGTIGVVAEEVGTRGNGVLAGTPLTLVDAIYFVESVALATNLTGGVNAETGEQFLDRGTQRLRRLVTTLVLPDHFTAAALEETTIQRATTLDNYDPAQVGNPGSHPGHVSVAVLGPDGAMLTAAAKADLETKLEASALANLNVHIIDPTITAVNVAMSVHPEAGFTNQQAIDAAVAALEAYLNPLTWEWGSTVYVNHLIAEIALLPEIHHVDAVTDPAANVALPGVAPLAKAGTLTVTVA